MSRGSGFGTAQHSITLLVVVLYAIAMAAPDVWLPQQLPRVLDLPVLSAGVSVGGKGGRAGQCVRAHTLVSFRTCGTRSACKMTI
jgi:hypothetical protein